MLNRAYSAPYKIAYNGMRNASFIAYFYY